MSKHNKILGQLGEEYVQTYLKKQGYRILETNYKTSFAEIDIIAQKKDMIAFVEVKTRETTQLGEPFEAVTKTKQRSIRSAATIYMLRHEDKYASLDIAEVFATITPAGLDVINFNYIENAFV